MVWTITTREVDGNAEICGTTYKGLAGDVKAGDPILIDDGKVRLRVTEVKDGTDVVCEVLVGGKVSDHKGINLPGVAVSVPALSEKDIEDLRFALHLTVDFIALSFVRSAADVEDVRRIMREENIVLPVIAKIEKPQAIENLDEVIAAFDGFMVARGDLGVECPAEEVPFLQKTIIDKARLNAKPVIVATQMLESMISSPSPTRAEVSDVANAILDGADAVMLSGETGVGEYPVHHRRDDGPDRDGHRGARHGAARGRHPAGAGLGPAHQGRGDRQGGRRGRRAHRRQVRRRLHPVRRLRAPDVPAPRPGPGPRVHPRGPDPLPARRCPGASRRSRPASVEHTDEMVAQVDEQLLNIGRVEKGDLVVIIAGSPPGIPGSTNALRVHRMGDAVDGVAPAYRRLNAEDSARAAVQTATLASRLPCNA